jgi:hypothetical protein
MTWKGNQADGVDPTQAFDSRLGAQDRIVHGPGQRQCTGRVRE